jgi:hypothetical protein
MSAGGGRGELSHHALDDRHEGHDRQLGQILAHPVRISASITLMFTAKAQH